MAVSSISSYLDSKLFLNVSVYDYLWGYDDPLVELANTVVPNWIDFPRFGIVDRVSHKQETRKTEEITCISVIS